MFLDDQASTALILNGVDPTADFSTDRDLFSNDGIINPGLEDLSFNSFDESDSSGRIPDGPETATNICASPLRKTRKRENADACSSPESEDSDPKLPSLDAFDLLQEAQKRRWCSKTGISVADFVLVCAYSGWEADEDTYWHVSGYLCEFLLPEISVLNYRDGTASTDGARHYF